ncbi:hypothetical protein SAMN05443144_10828 [Fodinibius roseus]|uniref:Short-chain dehydrogenase n=1 Tax=Fodinibius roseus TaxID=1194090 RepID=A0A1M5B847_9BACT|nr:SDR family oxidoreductase [Fodinibius roseus]SHF38704.1 hypothetical protein SAMN05443144_10828 [Fodinibius roseus]
MKIRRKLVVITGASRGIGKAVALNLAKKGARVILVARDRDKLREAANEIMNRNGEAHALICDVADGEMVRRICREIVKLYGNPDILINSAGFGVWKPFMDITEEEHRQMMDVNYWGTYYFIRELLPSMIEKKSGKIVNISSGSGKFALPVTSGYSASKFAVVGLSEALHRELLGTGVGVSCLNPGSVKTDFWNEERIPRKSIPPLVKYSPKLSPKAVTRWVSLCIWLPIPSLTFPFFVGILAKLNAVWIRLGDLLLWKWFFPVLGMLLLIRLLTKYIL